MWSLPAANELLNGIFTTSHKERNKHIITLGWTRRCRSCDFLLLLLSPFSRVDFSLDFFANLKKSVDHAANDNRQRSKTKLKVSRNVYATLSAPRNAIKSDSDRIKMFYIDSCIECAAFWLFLSRATSCCYFISVLESDWWFFYVRQNWINFNC